MRSGWPTGWVIRVQIQPAPTGVKARTDLNPSPSLSILKKAKPTMKGRMVGILVADGSDAGMVATVKAAAKNNGAMVKVVAPKVEGAKGADGRMIPADLQLAGGPSVLFDAVVVAVSAEGAQQLSMESAAIGFLQDAFAHLKVIGHTAAAAPLLQKANVMADRGVLALANGGSADAFLSEAAKGRIWEREPKVRTVV